MSEDKYEAAGVLQCPDCGQYYTIFEGHECKELTDEEVALILMEGR